MLEYRLVAMPADPGAGIVADQQELDEFLAAAPGERGRPRADRPRLLAARIGADQNPRAEHAPLQRAHQPGPTGVAADVERLAQREQLEDIIVAAMAGRRVGRQPALAEQAVASDVAAVGS